MNKRQASIARCTALRQEILLTMKANNLYISGELWLTLAFRTESELKTICRELHIDPAKVNAVPA